MSTKNPEDNGSTSGQPMGSLGNFFPDPNVLREYSEINQGAFIDWLMKQFEIESGFAKEENDRLYAIETKKIKLQREIFITQREEVRRGQLYGLLIGLAALICGSITSILGSPWSGGFIGAGGVVGLVAVFVIGRRMKSPE